MNDMHSGFFSSGPVNWYPSKFVTFYAVVL